MNGFPSAGFQFTSRMLMFLLLGLCCGSLTEPVQLQAQNLIVEQTHTAVAVRRENLDQAKQEALSQGKRLLVKRAIERFLDDESMRILAPVLDRHLLESPDLLIDSFRVINEETSDDRTEFTITLEARIFRTRLLTSLRNLGLTTRSEQVPAQKVLLLHDSDTYLSQPVLKLIRQEMRKRMAPYHVEILEMEKPDLPHSPSNMQGFLAQTGFSKNLAAGAIPLMLSVKMTPREGYSETESGVADALLQLWDADDQYVIAEVHAQTMTQSSEPQLWVRQLLDELMLVWHKVMGSLHALNRGESLVKITISGLPGPAQEQQLLKDLFQDNSRWQNLKLYALSRDHVVYQAVFSGKKKLVEQQLRKRLGPSFQLKNLQWKDTAILTLELEWDEIPVMLERYTQVMEVEEFYAETGSTGDPIPDPELQVPLTIFKSVYELPLGVVVYDQIRHRGDSTTYRLNSLQQNQTVSLDWFRLGKSNLKPLISLLDVNQNLIKRHYLGNKKKFRLRFRASKDETVIYIRISDETGYVEGIGGSFQFVHYLLQSS